MSTEHSALPLEHHVGGLHGDLLDICRRLKLSVQVVRGDVPSPALLANWWTPAGRHWSRLDTRVLHDCLSDVARSGHDRIIRLDHVSVAFAAIPGSAPSGVVMLARDDADAFGELGTIASWIASAVSDRASAASTAREIERLASLLQILDKATAHQSEREVIRAFVEALSVWTDTECWGYLGDRSGTFRLHVKLPGSAASAPARLDNRALVDNGAWLSVSDNGEGARNPEIALVRIEPRGGSDWLIALPAAPRSERESQAFLLYCQVLRLALSSLASVAISRLTWALFDCLAAAPDLRTMSRVAAAATAAVTEVVGAPVGLTVHDESDIVLSAGAGSHQRRAEEAVVVPLALTRPWTGTLSIGMPADRPLTRRDDTIAHHAAQSIAVWLNAALAAPWASSEKPVVQALEEPYGRIPEKELLIVSCEGAKAGTDDAAMCLDEIQRHLRPSDRVAPLPSGAFGVTLRDAEPASLEGIANRLRRALGACGQSATVVFPSSRRGPGRDADDPGLDATSLLALDAARREPMGGEA